MAYTRPSALKMRIWPVPAPAAGIPTTTRLGITWSRPKLRFDVGRGGIGWLPGTTLRKLSEVLSVTVTLATRPVAPTGIPLRPVTSTEGAGRADQIRPANPTAMRESTIRLGAGSG